MTDLTAQRRNTTIELPCGNLTARVSGNTHVDADGHDLAVILSVVFASLSSKVALAGDQIEDLVNSQGTHGTLHYSTNAVVQLDGMTVHLDVTVQLKSLLPYSVVVKLIENAVAQVKYQLAVLVDEKNNPPLPCLSDLFGSEVPGFIANLMAAAGPRGSVEVIGVMGQR